MTATKKKVNRGCHVLQVRVDNHEAQPAISPIGAFGAHCALYSLVMSPVCVMQKEQTGKSSPLTKDSQPPRDEKHEGKDWGKTGDSESRPSTCWQVRKNRPAHAPFTLVFIIGVHDWLLGAFLACPSLILNRHLRYLNMSGANFFAGAHHFVVRNSTFIETQDCEWNVY
jgi:hypothetical protein